MVQLYEHNKKTYDNLIKLFAAYDRVACVQPTGTGKSFIMLKLIEDNPEKKFLIASPSVYIFEQIKTHAEENFVDISNCKFISYQKITGMNEEIVGQIEADYIILDEFHRLGSAEWGGKGIDILLKTHEHSKILGTSATPIRYLDSMRNMAEEIFDGCYAVNMNLAEAIRQKILPLPVYITAWYSFSGEIAKIEKKLQKTGNNYLKEQLYSKIQKAKSKLTDADCGIDKILKKHIENKNGKYIIFCPNAESLETAQTECESWFGGVNRNVHVYSVYSYRENKKEQFEGFVGDESKNALKLLLCIDMLNEGVHIKGIDGVIMLRATKSANVFYQQLGRTLSCSKARPLIFDLVNNYETGDTAELYASMMEIGREYNDGSDMDITFEIYDYVRDIRTLLDDIYNTFEYSWEKTFEMLREFVGEFERFPHDSEEYNGYRLGRWCAAQRQLRKNNRLTEEKIDALNSIGFMWTPSEDIWYGKYCSLIKFKEERGRFPVPSDSKESDELKSLCGWCNVQRKNYRQGILTDEHIAKLTGIGFEFDFTKPPADEIWENHYTSLKEIYTELKRFPKTEEISDKKLHGWIRLQRQNYRKNKLSQERLDKLNKINFVWDTDEKQWNDSFEILKRFIEENNRVPSSEDRCCGLSIGQWYRKQCALMEQGSLSGERCEKMNSLDVDLTSYTDAQWFLRFEQLKTFIDIYGRLPKSTELYKGFKLYGWVNLQKNKLIKNKLEEKYRQAFESIDFDLESFSLDTYGDTWLNTFELLKRFIGENGRLPVSGETYEGYQIYWWLNHQKIRLKKGELEDRFREKFESINVDLLKFSLSVEDKWEINFEILKRFISENGRCPFKDEMFENTDVYGWLIRQKKKLINYELETDQAERLENLVPDIRKFSSRSAHREKAWNEKYELLEKFIHENGRCPRDNELYCGVDLYSWLIKEKNRLKKYKLEESCNTRLQNLGIELTDFPNTRKDMWQQRFEQVRTFIDEFKRYPYSGEVYDGFEPYEWIMFQRRKLNNDGSDRDILEKFRSINIDLPNFSASRPTE